MSYKVKNLVVKALGDKLYASWTIKASGNFKIANIDHYEVQWYYTAPVKKSSKTAVLDGGSGSVIAKANSHEISGISDDAIKVWCTVKPISKTHKVKVKSGKKTVTKEKAYFTGATATSKKFNWKARKAKNTIKLHSETPTAPSIAVALKNGTEVISVVLDTFGSGYKKVDFRLRNNYTKKSETTTVVPKGGLATKTWTGKTAGVAFDVQCRALCSDGGWTAWSEYSSPASSDKITPSAPEVELEGKTMTMSLETSGYSDVNYVEFYISQDSKYIGKNLRAAVKNQEAVATYTVTKGKDYKVRCRGEYYNKSTKKSVYTNWSSFSGTISTEDELAIPPTPSVEIDGSKMTVTCTPTDANSNSLTDYVEFQICMVAGTSTTVVNTVKATYTTNKLSVGTVYTMSAGTKYKVRCRVGNNGGDVTDWSGFSNEVVGIPEKVTGLSCKAVSGTSVNLSWNAATGAKSYTIEYTNDKKDFDSGGNTTTRSSTNRSVDISVDSGYTWFFRVRAIGEGNAEGDWSDIASAICGKKPDPPTTWSSVVTGIIGDEVILYWVHNSRDASSQHSAILYLDINGTTESYTIPNKYVNDDDRKDEISSYVLDTSEYSNDTTIKWTVATRGVIDEYSDKSIEREVKIYTPPSLGLRVYSSFNFETKTPSDAINEIVTSFPLYLLAESSPSTQLPISCHVAIMVGDITNDDSNYDDKYLTSNDVGESMWVTKGYEVYSKHFDYSNEGELESIGSDAWAYNGTSFLLRLTPGDVHLEDSIVYTMSVRMSLNSGLSVENQIVFSIDFKEVAYVLDAVLEFNDDNYSCNISPVCYRPVEESTETPSDEEQETEEVEYEETDVYLRDSSGEIILDSFGNPVEGVESYIDGMDDVEENADEGDDVIPTDIPELPDEDEVPETVLADEVVLSVYRREFDGSFTEIASGLSNTGGITVTDPHPALDYARYRIVGISNSTGDIFFDDLPVQPVGWTSIVIQWDEEWGAFDNSDYGAEELEVTNTWAGSLLVLPYNIDVSENNDPDVTLTKYIGREHPVSYYGTQLGSSATWKCQISRDDEETIYSLRRLSRYMGDVYVREPSGTGYWAHITISMDTAHNEIVIPVTISITRVEGGM